MAQIHLDGVGHSYDGGRTYALQPADILFENGKTYALLGPSGCGKTTMLNIVSGLLFPSDGRVRLGEQDVTRAAIADRNIAQVFQFPVVYRSKTVFGNLAFPLKCRNWDKARIERRVSEVAELLGLTARLGRSARSLTADEKQLISLGRGLVRDDVAALLMDEPLTVIDPQMKFDLRRRIKQANERTRHTVIYVTHDQNEAMTFADEILVMQAGRVIQRGTPEDLFERPLNAYVGTFIGSPGMNFVPATQSGGEIRIGGEIIRRDAPTIVGGTLTVGIRPEHIRLMATDTGLSARVIGVQDQGNVRVMELELADGARLKAKLPREYAIPANALRVVVPSHHAHIYADGVRADI